MTIGLFKNYPKKAYGLSYTKRLETLKIKPVKILVLYFYKWYWVIKW